MKEVLYMLLPDCPYCHQANRILENLYAQDERYRAVPIRRVDESAEVEFANSLDYYYVPCFYVDGVKRMEGVPSEEKVRAVLEEALAEA